MRKTAASVRWWERTPTAPLTGTTAPEICVVRARFLIHGDVGFDAAAGASTDRVTLDSVLGRA
jgi:hypothetical protein